MPTLKLALAVDANNTTVGDLYLNSQGQFQMTASLSEDVAQTLWTRFRFFQGEWFLDPRVGVPYFQQILGIKTSIPILTSLLKQVILQTAGIKSLDSFSISRVGRAFTVTFSCTLDDGTVLTSDDFAPLIIQGP